MKKSVPYLIAVIAGLVAFIAIDRAKDAKASQRIAENNAQSEKALRIAQRQKDSSAFADFRFEKGKEFEAYIEDRKQLQNTIERLGYKIKDVQSLIISQNLIIDSIKRSQDATPLVKYIRENRDTTAVFKFEAPCVDTQFSISYKDNRLIASQDSVRVETNDTIIGGLWKRKRKFLGINWNWLPIYKKHAKVTVVKECGSSQTQIFTNTLKN